MSQPVGRVIRVSYRCDACGHRSAKWMGFCPQCRADGALIEERPCCRGRPSAAPPRPRWSRSPTSTAVARPGDSIGIGEFDRVLGGGLVAGAVDPGGRRTRGRQVDAPAAGRRCAGRHRAGPCSSPPPRSRPSRSASGPGGSASSIPGCFLAAERDVDAIVEAAAEHRPDLLVVDSDPDGGRSRGRWRPGGVAQVRESAARLIHFAKESGVPVVLVGHITKDGGIAGPKLLEHVVDVVLYLEGDVERGLPDGAEPQEPLRRHPPGRSLRDAGRGDDRGPRPQRVDAGQVARRGGGERRLSRRRWAAPAARRGAGAGRRGDHARSPGGASRASRPPGSTSCWPCSSGMPVCASQARTSTWGSSGGIRLREPGADLPVALAIVSSLLDKPTGPLAAWGEVGLDRRGPIGGPPRAEGRGGLPPRHREGGGAAAAMGRTASSVPCCGPGCCPSSGPADRPSAGRVV